MLGHQARSRAHCRHQGPGTLGARQRPPSARSDQTPKGIAVDVRGGSRGYRSPTAKSHIPFGTRARGLLLWLGWFAGARLDAARVARFGERGVAAGARRSRRQAPRMCHTAQLWLVRPRNAARVGCRTPWRSSAATCTWPAMPASSMPRRALRQRRPRRPSREPRPLGGVARSFPSGSIAKGREHGCGGGLVFAGATSSAPTVASLTAAAVTERWLSLPHARPSGSRRGRRPDLHARARRGG
jgi:hypothetical protein